MSALAIVLPFLVYPNIDGQPLENGSVYIGQAGVNPVSNPTQIYWDEDLTIPAPNPFSTTGGGYASRNGSPGRVYVDGTNFSISSFDRNKALVTSDLNVTGISPTSDGIDFIADGAGRSREPFRTNYVTLCLLKILARWAITLLTITRRLLMLKIQVTGFTYQMVNILLPVF